MRATLAGPSQVGSEPGDPVRHRLLGPPTTRLGRLSLALLAIAVAWLVIPMVSVTAGVDNGSAMILEVVLLGIPLFLAFACAVSAGAAAALSLLRRGERSLLLALPLLVGAAALLFAVGELTTPH